MPRLGEMLVLGFTLEKNVACSWTFPLLFPMKRSHPGNVRWGFTTPEIKTCQLEIFLPSKKVLCQRENRVCRGHICPTPGSFWEKELRLWPWEAPTSYYCPGGQQALEEAERLLHGIRQGKSSCRRHGDSLSKILFDKGWSPVSDALGLHKPRSHASKNN